jgi:MtN3 and saliva related transmembrane protein
MTTVLAAIAATWGVAMALAPLLQIRTMRAHRSSRGVSVAYLRVLLVGFVLWLAYGLALHNAALIVSNVVAAVVCAATITVALRYRPG